MPVGGEPTENGIGTTVQTFVVPKLPAGDYFLYAACNEASACCEPLEPTFRVLGVLEGSPLPDAFVELEKFTDLDGAGNWAITVTGGSASIDVVTIPDVELHV